MGRQSNLFKHEIVLDKERQQQHQQRQQQRPQQQQIHHHHQQQQRVVGNKFRLSTEDEDDAYTETDVSHVSWTSNSSGNNSSSKRAKYSNSLDSDDTTTCSANSFALYDTNPTVPTSSTRSSVSNQSAYSYSPEVGSRCMSMPMMMMPLNHTMTPPTLATDLQYIRPAMSNMVSSVRLPCTPQASHLPQHYLQNHQLHHPPPAPLHLQQSAMPNYERCHMNANSQMYYNNHSQYGASTSASNTSCLNDMSNVDLGTLFTQDFPFDFATILPS